MLHTVNKSPFERNSVETCLEHSKDGSAILLIEDGVYAATSGTRFSDMVKAAMGSKTVYALKPDVDARGVQDKLMDGIQLVDYAGFVDLVEQHDRVQAWL